MLRDALSRSLNPMKMLLASTKTCEAKGTMLAIGLQSGRWLLPWASYVDSVWIVAVRSQVHWTEQVLAILRMIDYDFV